MCCASPRLFAFLPSAEGSLLAQGVFATLDGVLTDPTGAVVPNAKITLTDATSGSARDTVTDGAGFYNFVSVPVGTYNLAVSAGGFKDYAASGIALGGVRKSVNVTLTVGTADQTVSVNAENIALATTDSGERSFSLGTKELENFTQVEVMPPSTSRSSPASASRTAPATSRTITARPSASMPTATPAARALSTLPIPTTVCLITRLTSWPTARTSPILAATAIRRSIPTLTSCRNLKS